MSPKDMLSKTDEQLTEIMRVGERDDINAAITILQERHTRRLTQSIGRKLPKDWKSGVISEVWLAFFLYAKDQRIDNVGAFLSTLSNNKLVDAIRMLKHEREIESDEITIEDIEERTWLEQSNPADLIEREDDKFEKEHQPDYLKASVFIDRKLSDCERVIWTLHKIYHYPYEAISRLMGKSSGTIGTDIHRVRNKLRRYLSSDEFKLQMEYRDSVAELDFLETREAGVVVDQFAESAIPNLTPDEVKPLGIGLEEFKMHYEISIILPRWYEHRHFLQTNAPSLLLIRQEDKKEWFNNVFALAQKPTLDDFLFPRACLINIDMDGKNIKLTPQPMFEIVPDLYAEGTFLASHRPRGIFPVTMGFLDSSLYDEELLSEWPFVKNIEGW